MNTRDAMTVLKHGWKNAYYRLTLAYIAVVVTIILVLMVSGQ